MAKRNTTPPVGNPSGGADGGLSKSERRAQRAAQASAELAARRRREQIRRVGIIGAIVVALAVVFTVLVWTGTKQKGNDSATGVPPIGTSSYGLTIGDPKAPHTLVIYEDFICPYCGQFEAASHDGIAAAANAGKVYVEYRPFHLLPENYSAQALNAFAAVKDIAGNDAAKKLHDYFYAHQPSEEGPYPSVDDIVNDANQFVPAADQQKVDDAIRNNSYQSFVDGATTEAEQTAGVQGTPTIYLDGNHFLQGTSYSDVGKNLVAALNK